MDEEKLFTEKMNKLLNEILPEAINKINELNNEKLCITNASCYISDPRRNEILKEFGIESEYVDIIYDIDIRNKAVASTTMLFYGYKIEPESYFILPKNSRKVSVLDILRECIKQKTYMPKIYHLQDPIK